MRKLLKLLASAWALFFAGAVFAAHDPVILVPGLTAPAWAMETMRTYFISNGWPSERVFTWTDSSNMTGDLAQAGRELGAKVDSVLSQTGASKVVLITWSAATLASRWYLKNVDGAQNKVSMYFSMAGPHHGTTSADYCQKDEVSCTQFKLKAQFLTDLNANTETPGSPGVTYTTFRSTCDANVQPVESAKLSGADDRLTFGCLSHFDFPMSQEVAAAIEAKIIEKESAGRSPDCFKASNLDHIQAQHAYPSLYGVNANGTNDYMGPYSSGTITWLRRIQPGWYKVDPTCQ